MKVKAADIDFELARSYVNAGQIDRAEPLFLRAREEGEPTAEVTMELANLALKRGDPRRATQIIREGLDALRAAQTSARDTIGSVEGRARLERLLGDCTDAAGDHSGAEAAWRSALIGWERLMIEHLRRKNLGEIGRGGRRGRPPALSARPPRRRAAEVRRGDRGGRRSRSDVHRRDRVPGPARRDRRRAGRLSPRRCRVPAARCPNTSRSTPRCGCWTCRAARARWPITKAEAYLRTLDRRHGDLRPRRGAAWYHLLARYAVGQLTYEQMLAAADTTGKRAEIYFYEGMRRLGDGKSDDAHELWQKVIETRMFSFFEFDMASRYLRVGAPTAPPRPITRTTSTETI